MLCVDKAVDFFSPPQDVSFCKIALPSFSLCCCVFFREGFFVIEGGYHVIHCSVRANSGLLEKYEPQISTHVETTLVKVGG